MSRGPSSARISASDNRERAMAGKVASVLGGQRRGKTIAVLGLAFCVRETPSIALVTGLLDRGATVRAFNPAGMVQARRELPETDFCAVTLTPAPKVPTHW